MAQVNQAQLGYRHIRQTIRRAAKRVLVAHGVHPSTKSGNKEFNIVLNRLAMQSYSSLEAAAQAGQKLGQQIVELSKEKGKTHLDGGVIRQLVSTGQMPTVPQTSPTPAQKPHRETSPAASTPTAKAANDSPTDSELITTVEEEELEATASASAAVVAAEEAPELEAVSEDEEAPELEAVLEDEDSASDIAEADEAEPEAVMDEEPEVETVDADEDTEPAVVSDTEAMIAAEDAEETEVAELEEDPVADETSAAAAVDFEETPVATGGKSSL